MDTHSESPSGASEGRATVPPRRRFIGALVTVVPNLFATGWPRSARSKAAPNCLHLQDSRIADSHYYDRHAVLPHLRAGDSLRLRRQPENPHDERAIEVFWHEYKLGYLPRLDSAAAASLADRMHTPHAEIIGIDDSSEELEPAELWVWWSEMEARAAPEMRGLVRIFLFKSAHYLRSTYFNEAAANRCGSHHARHPRSARPGGLNEAAPSTSNSTGRHPKYLTRHLFYLLTNHVKLICSSQRSMVCFFDRCKPPHATFRTSRFRPHPVASQCRRRTRPPAGILAERPARDSSDVAAIRRCSPARSIPANPHVERAFGSTSNEPYRVIPVQLQAWLPAATGQRRCSIAIDRVHALTAEILAVENPDEAWEPIRLRVWALIDTRNPNGL
jgi:hypothetical protein